MKPHILVVDDEQDMTRLLKKIFEMELDCRVSMAFSGNEALDVLEKDRTDLMLCDIRMPGMDGFEVLNQVSRRYPDLTVMMITAFGSIETAIQAIKKGAYDFIAKPFEQDEILFRVKKALERTRLIQENKILNRENAATFGKLIGTSPPMQRVYESISKVAQSDVTVLITGESGTGKDLTAQSLHLLSPRHKNNFVPVNCPTVPEHILESELFGYKKGAFTHAIQNKKGLFQEADKGTIFLDEIGDIGPTIQTKLLRVLQEKEIKPLGDTRPVHVDVRIVASTNRDLAQKIAAGEFREDFFYRLNVFTIELPPLRDRRTDIPAIAEHLMDKHCKKLNQTRLSLSPEAIECLMERPWPGNVRELENVLIQGILNCDSDTITPKDIESSSFNIPLISKAQENQKFLPDSQSPQKDELEDKISALSSLPYKEAKEQILREFNHHYVGKILLDTKGNVTQAARQCKLERQALQQIMKRFEIEADRFR
ncbi:sigma-54 dependent transcriptional regulator [uncultured Desulfobacter sp.]|uniref:sigma-54-dependent transcriptional regulator n=1 Tax=uncultured Desulfobacter sp. TaxID=240139 RepID=UPI002AAB6897|nr:sigma-54 dependent transcriptional regulator [uncultured Desulfobacter sp.]